MIMMVVMMATPAATHCVSEVEYRSSTSEANFPFPASLLQCPSLSGTMRQQGVMIVNCAVAAVMMVTHERYKGGSRSTTADDGYVVKLRFPLLFRALAR